MLNNSSSNVLTCVPTSLRARHGIPYVVGPGYTVDHCQKCNREVWIGPKQVEFKKKNDAPVFCVQCVCEKYPDTVRNIKTLEDEEQ